MTHFELVLPAGRVPVKAAEVDTKIRNGAKFATDAVRVAYNEFAASIDPLTQTTRGWLPQGPETVYGFAAETSED